MIGTDITTAQHWLQQNDVVAIPTETVYGLAANAFSTEAVLNIFTTKNRPHFDPLIVHTHSIDEVRRFTADFPDTLLSLAKTFWPGPLTLLLPRNALIPDLVTSGLDRVGVRIPDHSLTLSLLRLLDFPLAAPSANPFGYISPTTAQHVAAQLSDQVPYILDGGACGIGVESTIVGIEEDQPTIYRLGGIAVEDIERVIGTVQVRAHSSSNPTAPGMLKSHYAPRKKLFIDSLEILKNKHQSHKIGCMVFENSIPNVPVEHQRVLSSSGHFGEAAQNLFAAMRALDALNIDVIHAELLPETGLGRAINDRIRRAAASD